MRHSEDRLVTAAHIFLGALGLGMILSTCAADDARAHKARPVAAQPEGWIYDRSCCHGNTVNGDCQDIPESAVTPIPGGYRITLKPGDHRLVTKVHIYEIEHSKVREAPDGRYHACLYPDENKLQCFYAPPMAF